MATARVIIWRALRKLGVLGLNQQADAAQEAEALADLQATIKSVLGFGGVNGFVNVRIDTRFDVDPRTPSQRLLCMSGGLAVTLPKYPMDGARVAVVDVASGAAVSPIAVNANGMRIEGAASVSLSEAGVKRAWMFRADLGSWERATDIEITSTMPFPDDCDDDIMLLAAFRMQTTFDAALKPPDAARVPVAKNALRKRYVKPPLARFDGAISTLGGVPDAILNAADIENLDT